MNPVTTGVSDPMTQTHKRSPSNWSAAGILGPDLVFRSWHLVALTDEYCMPLPGLFNLRDAVAGLYATFRGDDEDAARVRHLLSYVVHHSFTKFEGFAMPTNPKELEKNKYIFARFLLIEKKDVRSWKKNCILRSDYWILTKETVGHLIFKGLGSNKLLPLTCFKINFFLESLQKVNKFVYFEASFSSVACLAVQQTQNHLTYGISLPLITNGQHSKLHPAVGDPWLLLWLFHQSSWHVCHPKYPNYLTLAASRPLGPLMSSLTNVSSGSSWSPASMLGEVA